MSLYVDESVSLIWQINWLFLHNSNILGLKVKLNVYIFKVKKDDDLAAANEKLYKEMEKLMKTNLKETNRTIEEELNSLLFEKKKKSLLMEVKE